MLNEDQKNDAISPETALVEASAADGTANLTLNALASPVSITQGCGPTGPLNFSNKGPGDVISNVKVKLIMWGSAWNNATQLSAHVLESAFRKIVTGPYLSGLHEYGVQGPGQLADPFYLEPADPPNPLTGDNVKQLVSILISNNHVPAPDAQTLYFVVVPLGVNLAGVGEIFGEHKSYASGNARVRYAWIKTREDLTLTTVAFSHELVESCTDPDLNSWMAAAGACANGESPCELCDVCSDCFALLDDGSAVQAYWSQTRQACVVLKLIPDALQSLKLIAQQPKLNV